MNLSQIYSTALHSHSSGKSFTIFQCDTLSIAALHGLQIISSSSNEKFVSDLTAMTITAVLQPRLYDKNQTVFVDGDQP